MDIGTTVIKAGLFDRRGSLEAVSSLPLTSLTKSRPSLKEIDPMVWIRGMRDVVHVLRGRRRVEAVVVSGNGPTLVPVDGKGKALAPALTWIDQRGRSEVVEALSGSAVDVDATFFLAKAFWIFQNLPEVYAQTRFFLGCPEFIDQYLTGEAAAVLPDARFLRFFWNDEAIRALQMDTDRFPPFVVTGEVMGALKRSAAEELGLPEGIPVIAGGPDYIMSLLGTATIRPGLTCDRTGTSEGINHCSLVTVADPRLICLPHIAPGCHNVAGIISTTGKAVEWFRNVSGMTGVDFDDWYAMVAGVVPGAKGLIFQPYLAGERSPIWDPDARACFVGLTLEHTAMDMARAVVESIGYAMRDVLEVIDEVGCPVDTLRLAGVQSRNAVLNRIKADITGKRILIPSIPDAELMGGACVGLMALGEYASAVDAAAACVQMVSAVEPDRNFSAAYDELFSRYRQIHPWIKRAYRS